MSEKEVGKKSGRIRKKKSYYAQVSNFALRDKTLSLKAKGLLAIIESYLTLDDFVLYKNFLLNKSTDGETSFRGAWKELKDHGYLIQYKYKDEETKQFYYEYEICDNPNEKVDVNKKEVDISNKKPQVENQHMATLKATGSFSTGGFSTSGFSTSGKQPSIIKTLDNNILNNNNELIKTIKTNIGYDTFETADKGIVDNIVDVMNETLSSQAESFIIGGKNIQAYVVKGVLSKANLYHVQRVVEVVNGYEKRIGNVKGFLLSTLYNSIVTLESDFTNRVRTDELNKEY